MALIVLAVEELHKLGIIHCGINLNNIKLNRDGHVVLGNYSASRNKSQPYEIIYDRTKYEELHDFVDKFNQIDWWSVDEVWYQVLTYDIDLESYPCDFIGQFITNEQGDPPKSLEFFEGIDWSNLSKKKQTKLKPFHNQKA